MIIRECYVDGFGGSDDLCLEKLRAGLNVVVGPVEAKMKQLGHFIPAMLLGEINRCGIQLEGVSGSLSSGVESASIELIRIANHSASELHVLDSHGRPANDSSLPDRIQSIGAELFLSLYTDGLSLSDRLSWWQRTGTMQALTEPIASATRKPAIDVVVREQRVAKVQELRDSLAKLQQQRNQLQNRLEADLDCRQQYLDHKRQQAEAATRSEELRESIREARQQLKLLTAAFTLHPQWARRAEIQASLKQLRAIHVHAKDLSRVRQLDQKLQEFRQRLRALRNNQPAPPERVPPNPIEELIQAKSTIIQSENRIAKIHVTLERDRIRQSTNDDFATIRRLEDAAAALSAARTRHEASLTTTTQRKLDSVDELLISAPNNGQEAPINQHAVIEVRQRIETLKHKTRDLLHRRVLSPSAILALGALFSCGVAMILGSLIIDFNGYNFTVGLLGLTALGAVAFLKVSLEQPAVEELEHHRARIDQLITEIEQAEPESESDSKPKLAVCKETTHSDDHTIPLPSTLNELEQAKKSWTDLLRTLDLAPDTTITDAMESLQMRFINSDSVPNREIAELEAELTQHQSSFSHWQQQAASSLNRTVESVQEADVETVLTWLQATKSNSDFAAVETSHESQQQMVACQQQIKRHKRKRNKIFARTGVNDVEQLRVKIQDRRQIKPLKEELEALQIQIDASLNDQVAESPIKELLESHKETTLQDRIEQHQSEIQFAWSPKFRLKWMMQLYEYKIYSVISSCIIQYTLQPS